MPQRLAVDETLPLTVERFLRLGGKASPAARAAALDEVGAGRLADSPIQRVSGGEMQRVLLARALLREPDLLVLDEPVQGVDVAGQVELFGLITHIRNRRGCGVLMVSHDLHLVMAATDTVVCLNHHVCCTGRPEAVTRHPAYLELFGPLAAEGLAVYTHRHDHHHGLDGAVAPLPDQPRGARRRGASPWMTSWSGRFSVVSASHWWRGRSAPSWCGGGWRISAPRWRMRRCSAWRWGCCSRST